MLQDSRRVGALTFCTHSSREHPTKPRLLSPSPKCVCWTTRPAGWSRAPNSNGSAENIFQSQMETFAVLTKPGFVLEERMMPQRKTWKHFLVTELRLRCPPVRISMTNPLFQVLFSTKLWNLRLDFSGWGGRGTLQDCCGIQSNLDDITVATLKPSIKLYKGENGFWK